MDYIKQPQLIEQHSFEIISGIISEERPEYRFADPLQEKNHQACHSYHG